MSIVIRRNPIREMAAIQSAMDRLFEDTWRGYTSDSENTLAIDAHENDNAYVILANLPGVASDAIDITLHDGVLTISAELVQPEVAEGVRIHAQERPYGRYTRSLRLPKAVDAENVEANYENGVLALTLPKTPDAQPRQIPIKNGKVLQSEN